MFLCLLTPAVPVVQSALPYLLLNVKLYLMFFYVRVKSYLLPQVYFYLLICSMTICSLAKHRTNICPSHIFHHSAFVWIVHLYAFVPICHYMYVCSSRGLYSPLTDPFSAASIREGGWKTAWCFRLSISLLIKGRDAQLHLIHCLKPVFPRITKTAPSQPWWRLPNTVFMHKQVPFVQQSV